MILMIDIFSTMYLIQSSTEEKQAFGAVYSQ